MTIKIPDLNDDNEKAVFDAMIRRWIQEDNAVLTTRISAFNKIDDRLTSNISVTGFSQDYLGDLATANNPATEDDAKNPQLVSLNRARINHEAMLGDFLGIKRKLSIQARRKRKEKMAQILQGRVEYIEDSEMLPTLVYFPAFDNGFARGLHWIKATYDPQANGLKGRCEVSTVSARDVLVDCRSRGPFFQTARRKTHRFQLEVEKAREEWKIYPSFKPDHLGSDSEYDVAYQRTESTTEEFCTGYEVHFHQTITHYYQATGQEEEVEEIGQDEYEKMKENPVTEQMVFEGDKEEKYYAALFNTTVGTFHIEENPFGMDVLIPVVDIDSDVQLYPMGDVEIYSNLLDLLDVLVTVWLYNTKRTNKPFFDVDPLIYAQMQAEVDEKTEHGGVIPGLKAIHSIPQLNEGVTSMVQMLLGWIQDIAAKHSASMGQLPSKQISREALQMLIAKDRQSQGRKDITIAYALTMLAKLMVRMIIEFESEPDFFPVQNARRGMPGYIPINQRWTEQQYQNNLHELFEIPLEGATPAEIQGITKQLADAKKKFEQSNCVDIDPKGMEGYVIGNKELSIEELIHLQEQSGLSEEEFIGAVNPQPSQIKVYVVNDISAEKDADYNIRYSLDQDMSNDPQYKANKAMAMFKIGLLPRVDTLERLNEPNPEELVENLDAEQQLIQIARELAKRPDLLRAVTNVLQGIGKPQATGQPGAAKEQPQQ